MYPLIKPLYGLTDAGRQFWLKVRKILKDAGFVSLVGDKCYYLKYNEEGKLISHVDDMLFNGSDKFAHEVEEVFRMGQTNLYVRWRKYSEEN